jgi:crotonobetainyl-CoA:carnitine CoA-transferase CaiB-like acyl-CoA transferase
MAGPLAGIKVIEVGQALAGPLAGAILADLGADVIKVEKPDGGDDARMWGPPFIDESSMMFHSTNRNKRSVTIDIKSKDDIEKLKLLVRDADIMIQNLRPGIVEEVGIGPDVMRAVNPRLIYCSIWAFGNKGPMRNAPGFDPLAQAYGAVMTLTGRAEDPPTFCAPAINDTATGMWSTIGILAALQQRARSGEGCVIDTSLFESAVAWVGGSLNAYHFSGNVPERTGTASNNLVPYQTFETADRPVCIAAGNSRLFEKCAKVLGHPEWAADPRFKTGPDRKANREALVGMMEVELRKRTRAEWLRDLGKVGVPACEVNDIPELSESEQLAAMDMMRTLPGSNAKIVGLPIQFDGKRPHPYRDSPKVGEHNDEVFGALKANAAE